METFLKLNQNSKENNKNNAYMKQAEHLWSMLDDMASSNPDSYKKFIQKTLKEGAESIRQPDIHMCIKTSIRKPRESQLFINVFSWNKIPAAETDDDPIPVFGRELQILKNESYVNIAFNPQILEKYGKNSSNSIERDMLVKLALQYVESQTKCEINQRKYEIVKDFNCYGDLNECISDLTNTKSEKSNSSKLDLAKEALESIESNKNNLPDSILTKIANLDIKNQPNEQKTDQPQIIINKKPLIEEINSEKLACPAYEENISNDKKDTNLAIYEVKIYLPKISSMNECQLDIENDMLTLTTSELLYKKLSISLLKQKESHDIMMDDIEAKFIKKTSILRVKIPMVKLK